MNLSRTSHKNHRNISNRFDSAHAKNRMRVKTRIEKTNIKNDYEREWEQQAISCIQIPDGAMAMINTFHQLINLLICWLQCTYSLSAEFTLYVYGWVDLLRLWLFQLADHIERTETSVENTRHTQHIYVYKNISLSICIDIESERNWFADGKIFKCLYSRLLSLFEIIACAKMPELKHKSPQLCKAKMRI